MRIPHLVIDAGAGVRQIRDEELASCDLVEYALQGETLMFYLVRPNGGYIKFS